MACFDENTLIDIARGRTKPAALARAEQHLSTCDECAEALAAVASIAGGATPRAARSAPAGPIPSGTVINGTYRLLGLVGRGGMGDVYEAAHVRLSGRRAIKLLNGDPDEIASLTPRFTREAGIASALRHPNIVQVLDFNVTEEGRPYLVMEYLEGLHFGDLIESEAPIPLARVLELVTPVVSALGAVHAQQVVHRDLKPQNIMLVTDGDDGSTVVKLLDFGLAKRRGRPGAESLLLSKGRALLGTPMYMAPEQARGDMAAVGLAADQFSLAAIVYEMLTRRPPFYAESIPQVLYRVVSVDPPLPRSFAPGLPAGAEAAVMRALAKDPERRFPSVKDFLDALRAPAAGAALSPATAAASRATPATGPRPPPGLRAGASSARRAALAGAAALSLVGAVLMLSWRARPGAPPGADGVARGGASLVGPPRSAASSAVAPAPSLPEPLPVAEVARSADDRAPAAAAAAGAGPVAGPSQLPEERVRRRRRASLRPAPAAKVTPAAAPDSAPAAPPRPAPNAGGTLDLFDHL